MQAKKVVVCDFHSQEDLLKFEDISVSTSTGYGGNVFWVLDRSDNIIQTFNDCQFHSIKKEVMTFQGYIRKPRSYQKVYIYVWC